MICKIRKWDLADAADLAAALSNRKVQDNLRDGLSESDVYEKKCVKKLKK